MGAPFIANLVVAILTGLLFAGIAWLGSRDRGLTILIFLGIAMFTGASLGLIQSGSGQDREDDR